ncbi:MAG: CotH kinase family protein [Lachnospiraceae bacterium]|nr:CotH kinase family protein [Lachnospiraceae bacterium]
MNNFIVFINTKNQKFYEGLYSFIRRFMIDELFNNPDTMQTSYYFYRQSDTLYAGPCWDYDLSCGKSLNGMDFYDYSRSILDDMSEDCLDWDPVLLANEIYRHEYAAAFAEYMPLFNDLLETRIDSYAKKISASLEMDRALWQNDEIPVRFYSDAGNKYRFIKFYLYKRMQLLASYCGYNAALPDISLNKSETHSVTFVTENGSSSLDVSDGTLLSEKDLPDYDHTRFSGWKYQREDKPFSHFLPVYEDISLELMPIPPT